MNRLITMIALVAVFALAAGAASAQTAPASPPPSGKVQAQSGPNFVDEDGDGICDRYQTGQQGARGRKGRRYGPGDGTGNQGVGPRDGTGYGAGSGGGTCDGTGPKGQRRGRGGR